MAKAIFIFGGCRSGKSSYAVQRVKNCPQVSYIATSMIMDDEMQLRIQKHREERPQNWQVVEEPYRLSEAIRQVKPGAKFVIVDCLTMYLANHFGQPESLKKLADQEGFEAWLKKDIQGLMTEIRSINAKEVLLISNEVGLGIVPVSKQTRFFRDMCGLMNQWVASQADEVIKMEAGLANRLK